MTLGFVSYLITTYPTFFSNINGRWF